MTRAREQTQDADAEQQAQGQGNHDFQQGKAALSLRLDAGRESGSSLRATGSRSTATPGQHYRRQMQVSPVR
jgi:hypothetical protein